MYGIIQPTLAKLHLLLHPPLVEDHLVWETIFIWIQVRSLKRGTTVLKKISATLVKIQIQLTPCAGSYIVNHKGVIILS